MTNLTYFVNISDIEGITLYYASVTFCRNGLVEIDYCFSENDIETKEEAEWFDALTYTF